MIDWLFKTVEINVIVFILIGAFAIVGLVMFLKNFMPCGVSE